jgi:hypothetical protein
MKNKGSEKAAGDKAPEPNPSAPATAQYEKRLSLTLSQRALRKSRSAIQLGRNIRQRKTVPMWTINTPTGTISAQKNGVESHVQLPIDAAEPSIPRIGGCNLTLYSLIGLTAGRRDEVLRCKMDLPDESMRINWTGSTIVLATSPATIDPDKWAHQQWRQISDIDPRAYRTGLRLVNLASKTNKKRPHLSIIEIDNGRLRGGCPGGLIVVQSHGLGHVRARISASASRVLIHVLSNLSETAKFFESESHWMIRDNWITCCIEKPPPYTFPDVEAVLRRPLMDRFHVVRADFLDRLSKLTVVQRRGQGFVDISWSFNHKMHLEVRTTHGTEITDLTLYPIATETLLTECRLRLRSDLLIRIGRAFPAGQLFEFGLSNQHTLAMRCGDEFMEATAFLSGREW